MPENQKHKLHLKTGKIAEITGAVLFGDPEIVIENLAKIDEAKAGDLTFLYLAGYEKFFLASKASAIFVKPGFEKTRTDITYLEVEDPNKAFFTILISYFTPEFPLDGIHPSAIVDSTAVLGKNVSVGSNVSIGARCIVGDGTKIFANTVLMNDVQTGNNCLIFPNVTIREECRIGNRVILQPGAVIGSDGFGYVPGPDKHLIKIPQIGIVVLEDDVEIGANTCIDRAALGTTTINRGTKLDNLVQIAHNVTIGQDTVISAQTGVSGSSKIGNNCTLAGQVGMSGHIEISDNIIVAGQAGVSKSLKKPGMYSGYPVKEHKTAMKLEAHLRSLPVYADRIKELETKLSVLEAKIASIVSQPE
ncbi:MAG: UDP-3-O-(3-hydroxymyristoyl)glucosamine N-acyltransferase [Ignavibacteriales bacterium]|nr:UDP-3-O-(3-hydroxymyristoyl)glucosamine N-acyltransferase [Ignavibacteriales bacterium]